MKGAAARLVGFTAGLLAIVGLGWVLGGQASNINEPGIPTDWSHRHLIFSRPATAARAAIIERSARYWQQWARRNVVRTLEPRVLGADGSPVINLSGSNEGTDGADWSEFLGNNASVGPGNYPAKWGFKSSVASCTSDYVVFNTGLAGSSSQATVVAFNNLYSGCGGTVPSVTWAYNTGGQVLTSPVISKDGTQVAFVQTAGGFGTLILLKFAASTTQSVGAPRTLAAVSNALYRNCTAPCMTQIFLRDGSGTQTDDTTSSVFPDYDGDVIWVGGARGWLHKLTGVFIGTPAEVRAGGFPAHLSGNSLSSPVFDYASKQVFVGDYGGFMYRVSATGVATATAQIDHGAGLVAAPIVDSTAGKVYAFSSNDNSTNCTGSVPCAGVYLFPTNFASGATGTEAAVGASNVAPPNPNPLFEGDFDSTYQASSNATGNLYVCGNTGGPPILYQIPINAGVMGTVVAGPALSNATTGCSPVSDISNPNATGGINEWIFASVQGSSISSSCTSGGCMTNFVVQPWLPATAYKVGQEILDNHFQIQVAWVAGTSRSAAQGPPTWNTVIGSGTPDNTAHWVNQGPQSASHAAWQASHAYALGDEVIDTRNNIQAVITAGTSRAAGHPGWNANVFAITNDNTVQWRNVGAVATAGLAAAGGTSGVIMDNTVPNGTLAGASQIYYSTQSNQNCKTSGGSGGCAVQASQSALK